MELDDRLHEILVEVLGEEYRGRITLDMTMDDIREWDSMSFVNLLLGIEESYGIELSLDEAVEMTRVSTIQETIRRKLTEAGPAGPG